DGATSSSPSSSSLSSSAAALVIGTEYVAYANARRMERLPGCHLDAQHMQSILTNKYSVSKEHFIVLVDDGRRAAPTKKHIIQSIDFLFNQNRFETIFMTYSGHGSYTRATGASKNQENGDGRNETIVPADFRESGMLVDDQLH